MSAPRSMKGGSYDADVLAQKVHRVELLLSGPVPPSGYYHLDEEEARIAALALSLFGHVSPLIVEALEKNDVVGLS